MKMHVANGNSLYNSHLTLCEQRDRLNRGRRRIVASSSSGVHFKSFICNASAHRDGRNTRNCINETHTKYCIRSLHCPEAIGCILRRIMARAMLYYYCIISREIYFYSLNQWEMTHSLFTCSCMYVQTLMGTNDLNRTTQKERKKKTKKKGFCQWEEKQRRAHRPRIY